MKKFKYIKNAIIKTDISFMCAIHGHKKIKIEKLTCGKTPKFNKKDMIIVSNYICNNCGVILDKKGKEI